MYFDRKDNILREIFSFIFDKATDPLTLPIHFLWEWLILGVIGEIAYQFAFRKVGCLYRTGVISGRFAGSLLHWIIRFFIYVPVWAIVYWVIVFVQWIIAHWVAAIIITILAVILGIVVRLVYRSIKIKQAVN